MAITEGLPTIRRLVVISCEGEEAVILRKQTVRSFWEQDFYKAKLCASVSNSTFAYRTCRLASENPSSNVGRGTPIYGLDRV